MHTDHAFFCFLQISYLVISCHKQTIFWLYPGHIINRKPRKQFFGNIHVAVGQTASTSSLAAVCSTVLFHPAWFLLKSIKLVLFQMYFLWMIVWLHPCISYDIFLHSMHLLSIIWSRRPYLMNCSIPSGQGHMQYTGWIFTSRNELRTLIHHISCSHRFSAEIYPHLQLGLSSTSQAGEMNIYLECSSPYHLPYSSDWLCDRFCPITLDNYNVRVPC